MNACLEDSYGMVDVLKPGIAKKARLEWSTSLQPAIGSPINSFEERLEPDVRVAGEGHR